MLWNCLVPQYRISLVHHCCSVKDKSGEAAAPSASSPLMEVQSWAIEAHLQYGDNNTHLLYRIVVKDNCKIIDVKCFEHKASGALGLVDFLKALIPQKKQELRMRIRCKH